MRHKKPESSQKDNLRFWQFAILNLKRGLFVRTKMAVTITNTILLRSPSNKDLYAKDSLKRSHSAPQLRCVLNPSHATATEPKLRKSHSFRILPFGISVDSVKSFLFHPEVEKEEDYHSEGEEGGESEEEKRVNWMERVLELRGNWKKKKQNESVEEESEGDDDDDGGCEVEYEEEEEVQYDREMFSKLLVRVSWSVTKLFSQLAFLCNLAYVIPDIKAEHLRKYYDLHFVTSSLEKKARAAIKANLQPDTTFAPMSSSPREANSRNSKPNIHISPNRAYEVAASAATYLHSSAKNLLALGNKFDHDHGDHQMEAPHDNPTEEESSYPYPSRTYNSEVAAYVAAQTMTSVVAAEEAAKQEAAKELQSLHSTPCEWFVCDDPSTCTRCFVIQGSDSRLSWQANLFFEPAEFEGTDVMVHRGIYEAAKGIYAQFMPEIQNHLETYGARARFRFTGHSLGGSLSVLVSLMLLTRKIVKPSTLLPVVTFGSPFVFCGGSRILELLGLEESHIQSVMMHRDIVPRAFSCNYPNQIAQILKRLNGPFRSHACLNANKMLYTPLGRLFILQPDSKSSPPHPLLPHGSALYELDKSQSPRYAGVASALRAFLNSPHPLETLSDPTAYGSGGTILRDHDSSNYLKAVNSILRQHTKSVVRQSRRERLHHAWPQLQSPHSWSQQELEMFGLAQKEVATGV